MTNISHIFEKSDKIILAKSFTGNTMCIDQNRPLFGFIPIYGLKSRVYDVKNNPECTDLLLLHKRLRVDGLHNYADLQIPIS